MQYNVMYGGVLSVCLFFFPAAPFAAFSILWNSSELPLRTLQTMSAAVTAARRLASNPASDEAQRLCKCVMQDAATLRAQCQR